jgi:hypothetical protein
MAVVFDDTFTGSAGVISGHSPDVAPVGFVYSANNGDPRLDGSGALINFETNGLGEAISSGATVVVPSYPFSVSIRGNTDLIGFGQFRVSLDDGVSSFKVFLDVRRDAPTDDLIFCRVFIDSQGANFGYSMGGGNVDVELKGTFYANGDVDVFVNGVQVFNVDEFDDPIPWVFNNAPPPLEYVALYPGAYADNAAGWNYAELTRVTIETVDSGVTVTPDAGAITTTGLAPTVTVSAHQVAEPGAGAIAVTGLAPTVAVGDSRTAEPGAGSIAVTGQAPVVVVSDLRVAEPGAGALTVTGLAPTVVHQDNRTAAPDAGVIAITGLAPAAVVGDNKVADPGAGSIAATGLAPTVEVSAHQVVEPDAGQVTVTGLEPTVVVSDHHVVEPGAGVISATGLAPQIAGSMEVSPDAGEISIVGLAPTVLNTTVYDDVLDAKYLGGNVKFKPVKVDKAGPEPMLPADVTNMPDAPPQPARRYSLMASLDEVVDETLFREKQQSTPVPAKKAAPAQQSLAPAAPVPAPAPAIPAPAVDVEAIVAAATARLREEMSGQLDALALELEETKRVLTEQAEAKVDEFLANVQASRERELEDQVDAILDGITTRRRNNARRAEAIARKFLNS